MTAILCASLQRLHQLTWQAGEWMDEGWWSAISLQPWQLSYQQYPATRPALNRLIAGRLGIAQSTWGRACQQFGRERAALSVLLIDRNAELPVGHRYRVLSPGRCLAGMIRRTGTASVNLAGLFRATERYAQQSPPETTSPPQPIESPPGPMAHLAARLMASMELRVSDRESQDPPGG